jgi:hypothetical protein
MSGSETQYFKSRPYSKEEIMQKANEYVDSLGDKPLSFGKPLSFTIPRSGCLVDNTYYVATFAKPGEDASLATSCRPSLPDGFNGDPIKEFVEDDDLVDEESVLPNEPIQNPQEAGAVGPPAVNIYDGVPDIDRDEVRKFWQSMRLMPRTYWGHGDE